VTCELETDERRHRSARDDQPAGAIRQPEGASEPARELELDLRRSRGEPPGADVAVHAGRDKVGDHPGRGAGTGDVGHETGMARVGREVEHDPTEVREQLVVAERLLGNFDRHRLPHLRLAQWTADGQGREPLEQLFPELESALTQRASPLGRPVEIGDRIGSRRHGCILSKHGAAP
jgi:hypothetical protein